MVKDMKSEDIKKWVDDRLYLLDAPEVFVPDMNSVTHDWEKEADKPRYCFLGLTEYGQFIANLGVGILYDELNRNKGIIAERAYAPEPKLHRRMTKGNIPLFSKETYHQLKDFDVIGMSSYYPLQFFGVPLLLEMAGLSIRTEDREENDPITLLGGVAVFNPAPIHKFVDIFMIGDGEDVLAETVHLIHSLRKQGVPRKEILLEVQKTIQGAYVPSFYEEIYYLDGPKKGQIKEHRALIDGIPTKIKKVAAEIKDIAPLTKMIASNSDGQEMGQGSLEITRGCANKCQFCEGSYRSQPYRERSIEAIKKASIELMKNTGSKDITPYGFNLSDHHLINDILAFIMESYDGKISMSSQHLEFFTEDLARVAYATGNRSITVAIESGSQRMRTKMGKNLDEKKILEAFRIIFKVGFTKAKIYMIADLPDEQKEDTDAAIDIAKKIDDVRREVQGDNPKTSIRYSWCVAGDTNVLTDRGYIKAKALVNIKPGVVRLKSPLGWVNYKKWESAGIQDTRTFKFADGTSITTNLDHPFRSNRKPLLAKDVNIGDKIDHATLRMGVSSFENKRAYMLGFCNQLQATPATLRNLYYITPRYKVSYDKTLSALRYAGLNIDTFFGSKSRLFISETSIPSLTEHLDNKGMIQRVPKEVLGDPKSYSSYLRGLFDSCGTVQGRTIRYYLSSEKLAREVALLLDALGFSYTIRENKTTARANKWSISLTNGRLGARNFVRTIGSFFQQELEEKVEHALYIPKNKPTRERNTKKVVSISNGREEVFGPVFVKDGWYLANGVFNHNTPFNVKAHTPLQFAPVAKLNPETGYPLMEKSLDHVIDAFREMGFGTRVSVNSELSSISQCLSIGDRRMCDVIEDIYTSGDFNYKGGLSLGMKHPSEDFGAAMEKRGISYAELYKEKEKDQIFAWDFIDMGVTRKFLEKAYFDYYKGEKMLSRCQTKCTGCGACNETSKKLFQKHWKGTISKGRQDLIQLAAKHKKRNTVVKCRFKVNVNPKYRFVHTTKIKNYIRRAFYRIDAPIKTSITLSSDKLKFNDWTYGIDFGEVPLYTRQFDSMHLLDKLNATFDDTDIMKFESVDIFTDNSKSISGDYESILYSFDVPKSEKSFRHIDSLLKTVLEQKEFIIRLKVKGEKRDTTRVIDYDARPHIINLWSVEGNETTRIFAQLKEQVGVYELFPAIFSTAKRNILKYPVKRETYLVKKGAEGVMDMFASLCDDCGAEIEENAIGEPISETKCMKCFYSESFEDAIVVETNHEIENEFKDDEQSEISAVDGHDEEDTDPLEELKAAGFEPNGGAVTTS